MDKNWDITLRKSFDSDNLVLTFYYKEKDLIYKYDTLIESNDLVENLINTILEIIEHSFNEIDKTIKEGK